MITNRKDAVTELMRARYLYAHLDGTFVTRDGAAFSEEVFDELKKEGRIALISGDGKRTTALYKFVPITGLSGPHHFHEHD